MKSRKFSGGRDVFAIRSLVSVVLRVAGHWQAIRLAAMLACGALLSACVPGMVTKLPGLSGSVYDARTMARIPGAKVRMEGDGRMARTDQDGSYEFPRIRSLGFVSLIPGKVSRSSIEVSHPDFGTQTAWFDDTSENSNFHVFLWPLGFGGVPSSGNFPSIMQTFAKGKTAYFAFSFDRGVPFNPVKVRSPRQRWDFSASVRSTPRGNLLEMVNQCGADIPIMVSGGGGIPDQRRTVRGNTRLALPCGQSGEIIGFFFYVYDTAAIKWPADFAPPPWLPAARPPRRMD